MRFYDFIKENVVGLPTKGENPPTTLKHLKNLFGWHDPEINPGVMSQNAYRLSVRPYSRDSSDEHSFSVYGRNMSMDHATMKKTISKQIQQRGGEIIADYSARLHPVNEPHGYITFKDGGDGHIVHAVIKSVDRRSKSSGWNHEIHIVRTEQKHGITESVFAGRRKFNVYVNDKKGNRILVHSPQTRDTSNETAEEAAHRIAMDYLGHSNFELEEVKKSMFGNIVDGVVDGVRKHARDW